ncbi:MAG: hypothetical protein ABI583_11355 [Betaproteobacteria bacterium]
MDTLIRYWYVIFGVLGMVGWIFLFLNRDRIESPWVRSLLGLSLEDPLLKATMQGRKDFTRREVWGWVAVLVIAAFAIYSGQTWLRNL